MMTVTELLSYAKKYIHSDYAKILLGELIDMNPLELYNHLNDEIEKTTVDKYKEEVLSIKEGKPIQYVIGSVNFFGNRFIVDERVLIPRFETEELVETSINYIDKYFNSPVDIIDLGCGSGIIGLTLEKKVSTNSVDLVDISLDVLEITEKNREKLGSKAKIIQSDMFSNINKKYDVIISNPPYIREDEEIEDIVEKYEPHIALYGGKDGLYFYDKILKDISTHMKDRCLICFEIGVDQAKKIEEIANKYLDNITVITKKDLSGRDRMLFILKNLE